MKFVIGENGRNPEKNLTRHRFVHHEIYMEWQRRELGTPEVGGEPQYEVKLNKKYLLSYIIKDGA